MALQFIIGGSGSGKTEWIYRRLLEQAEQNKKKNYYMIVPDQFTMQTQKALVARQKNHAILNIDVVSFDRLAYRIFDELGKNDVVVLEDSGKNLILRKLAEDCKDQLKTLKNQIHRISYIDQIKSLISEFMQYGIEPEDLESYLDKMEPNSALYYKLSDMLLLYQAFEKYLREGYVTSEKILSVLADVVKDSDLLQGAVLAFDGFTGFTPVQMKLVEQLLAVAEHSYMTVTMDSDEELYADKGIQDLFYMSRKMIRGVAGLAKRVNCTIEDPVLLVQQCEDIDAAKVCNTDTDKEWGKGRFCENPILRHLEQNLFRPKMRPYKAELPQEHMVSNFSKELHRGDCEAVLEKKKQTGILLYSLANPKDELIFAAMKIRSMVKEHGYRYQDFAIVSGNVAGYEKYAKEVFEMYEIPYFSDVKETIYYHPFTEWVRALLEMMETGFAYDSVFRYLRCGLSGFTDDEIDVLDNYVLEKGIRGYKKWSEKWVRPFRQIGRGVKKTEEEQTAALLQLNMLRERFLAQLAPVSDEVRAGKGKIKVVSMTKALYQVMVELKIQEQLKEKQTFHEKAGSEYLAATYGQIYRIVIDLLDKVVDLLGEDEMPIKEYAQILDAGFLAAKVGTVPRGFDCVILGDIERTRLDHIKVLFFLGVNDGIVPKMADRKNLLSQYDRERMAKDQIELAPTTREQVFLQKFYLYLNMTKPQDALILTYARMDSMGTAQKPSYLISTMQSMYPQLGIKEVEADFSEEMMTARSSSRQYVKGLKAAIAGNLLPEWRALHEWRIGQPEYQKRTQELLDAAFAVFDGKELSPEVANKLYGQMLYHSVTRLERFFQCAYAHFLQYGLNLTERQEYSFEAADLGNVFHDSIECYCRKMREEGLDWFEISEVDQERLLTNAVSETLLAMDTAVLADSARSHYMVTRISNILGRSVWALTKQIRKGEFVPKAYEVGFFKDIIEDKMSVVGRIDRVDTYENEQQVYVKIMDYKSGKKTFDLQKIYNGQDLQLAVYMNAAIDQLRTEFPEKDIVPAGMLYYQMEDPSIDDQGNLADTDLEQKVFEKLRPEGLVNSDLAVLDKFDYDLSGKSDVIPVSFNKDGSLSKRGCSVASREQFEILDRFVMDKMKQAGEDILQGKIAPEPLKSKQVDGCTWCPYTDICGFDKRIPGYRIHQPEEFSEEVLWGLMAEKNTDKEK